ncbi:gliding motility lipoprotein GldH [Roseivirga sp.]|uniref:gliding motility lipoprotein GldH n=1 Tax=Roseivirga sp. TaxID=1964215 RepID=UPI003B8E0027
MSKLNYWIVLLCLLLFVGCDTNRVYEADYDFDELSWHMDTIPNFQFEVEDTAPKDLIFKIRNSLDFPFRNCYVKYDLSDTLGNTLTSDLINIELFDEKTGKPFGSGNSVFQHSEVFLEGFNFPESGTYNLSLTQYMRKTDLIGTYSLGLRVEESSGN